MVLLLFIIGLAITASIVSFINDNEKFALTVSLSTSLVFFSAFFLMNKEFSILLASLYFLGAQAAAMIIYVVNYNSRDGLSTVDFYIKSVAPLLVALITSTGLLLLSPA